MFIIKITSENPTSKRKSEEEWKKGICEGEWTKESVTEKGRGGVWRKTDNYIGTISASLQSDVAPDWRVFAGSLQSN